MTALAIAGLTVVGVGVSTAGPAAAATNGQQICIWAPSDVTPAGTWVHVEGANQNGQWTRWDGQVWNYGSSTEACTWGWWWKGGVTITADGRAYRLAGYVPDFQIGSDVKWFYL